MHVNNILAGLRQEDVNKSAPQSVAGSKQLQLIKDKEVKYKAGANLQSIKEEKFEVESHGSMPSQAIDDIVTMGKDPRRNKNEPTGIKKNEEDK